MPSVTEMAVTRLRENLVLVVYGLGQPASLVGASTVLTILKSLFGGPLVGEFVTAPQAAPPNATQHVSPPVMVKRIPPSVPGAGWTTVM